MLNIELLQKVGNYLYNGKERSTSCALLKELEKSNPVEDVEYAAAR
jgi:hypothetical protein